MKKKATIEINKLIVFILVAILLIFLLIWYGYLSGEGGLKGVLDNFLNII